MTHGFNPQKSNPIPSSKARLIIKSHEFYVFAAPDFQELAHPTWKRRGCHLFLEKTISLSQAPSESGHGVHGVHGVHGIQGLVDFMEVKNGDIYQVI